MSLVPGAAQSLLGGDSVKGVAQLGEDGADQGDLISGSAISDAAGDGRDHHRKFTGSHRVLQDAAGASSAGKI
jgi:hypothetical protein